MRFHNIYIYYYFMILYQNIVYSNIRFPWDNNIQEKRIESTQKYKKSTPFCISWIKNMNKGKWIDPLIYKDSKSPYFKISEETIYAVKHNAKISMDIKDIHKTEENIVRCKMHNLKMHSIPLTISLSDYKILDLIHKIMKHGLTFKIEFVNDSFISAEWNIFDESNNKTFQKGICLLSYIEE